jgi:diguanylate cyclase (GGDEF)-like protein
LLLLEDSPSDATLVERVIRKAGWDVMVRRMEDPVTMAAALASEHWDLVISDNSMPAFDALGAIKVLQTSGQDLPLIVVSGCLGEDTAVSLMKAGAHDYVMKDNLTRLPPAIERELREAELRRSKRKIDEQIQQLAYHDARTGLPNRNRFLERIGAEIQHTGNGNGFTVLLLELARFIEINNTIGYEYTDGFAAQVASRLSKYRVGDEFLASLGEDRFGILVPAAGEAGGLQAAARYLGAFAEPFGYREMTLELLGVVGLVVYPDHGAEKNVLLRRAGIALEAAWTAGTLVRTYTSTEDEYSQRRLELVSDLWHAADRGQLALHYQPKLSLVDGTLHGVEALARWRHPRYGMVPPDQFIPLAEQTGIMRPLTSWVMTTALEACRRWNAAGVRLPVAVNFSPNGLLDCYDTSTVTNALDRAGLTAEFLGIEITESGLMKDPVRAQATVERLVALGTRISIDDFGTGYSSLAYLKNLSVHALKIDKSFIIGSFVNPRDVDIVRATIDLAHHLGMEVVAEGVENAGTMDRLRSFGCDEVQGYHVAAPMEGAALLPWLERSPWKAQALAAT